MNVEVRKVGNKKKYYLAHSFREGKKVHKIRRYLGSNLSKDQLENLKVRAEEIIKQQIKSYKLISDPLTHELSQEELKIIDELIAKQDFAIFHLSAKQWEKFTQLFTYNTNAIEGSELLRNEVEGILEEADWPQDKSKFDIAEAIGVAEAVKYIRNQKAHVSLALIKKLHHIVFRNSKSFAGKLRSRGVEVVIRDGLGNIIHAGAPSNRVVGLLQELVEWYSKHKKKYHPIILAAVVHNQFENIHPFADGNGRVGRLLLNNVLLQQGLPPVNISFINRREYYNTLQKYEKEGDLRPTIELMLKEFKKLKKELK